MDPQIAPNNPSFGNSFRVGDKVIKQCSFGPLQFGQILGSEDGQLSAIWDNGRMDNLDASLLTDPPKIGVFDRPLTIGSRVRHLGKEGQVFGTHPVVTAYLADHDSLIVFPQLHEHMLRPILNCKIGDLVTKDGWIGVVTSGEVEVSYKYRTGSRKDIFVILKKSLKVAQDEELHPSKPVQKLSYDLLKKGRWSSGLGVVNALTYRNKSCVISKIETSALSVFWYDRLKPCPENEKEPLPLVSVKDNVAELFSLNEPTSMDKKFTANSVWTLRWNENIVESYDNWKERFVEEFIYKEDNMDEAEAFYKRAKPTLDFSPRERVAVKVLFYQTTVEVLFEDGSTITKLSTDLTEILEPCICSSLQFPDRCYLLAEVVRDKIDFQNSETKYGFVLSQSFTRRTVLVKWVLIQRDGSVLVQEAQEMSQHDIIPYYKYSLLKNSPQLVLAQGKFEGLIISVCLPEAKVRVQCAEGPIKSFWAHELTFCTKKVFYSSTDGWISTYIQLPQDVFPTPMHSLRNSGSALLGKLVGPNPRLFMNSDVPWDHSWVNFKPQNTTGSHFTPEVEQMLSQDIKNCLSSSFGNSLWIEKIAQPGNNLMTILVMPYSNQDSIYKNVPFFLDILIPQEYPQAFPRIMVRLPRVYQPSWIHPLIGLDGEVQIPDLLKATIASEAGNEESGGPLIHVVKFLMENIFEIIEPFLGLRQTIIKEDSAEIQTQNNSRSSSNNNSSDQGFFKELNNARDYNETALITIAEYIHSLLCQPPSSWKEWIENHFHETLFRICWRYTQFCSPTEEYPDDTLITINQRKKSPFLIYPVSESFKLAVKSRMDCISPFIQSIN